MRLGVGVGEGRELFPSPGLVSEFFIWIHRGDSEAPPPGIVWVSVGGYAF